MNNTLKRSLWIQPSLLAPWTSVPQRQDVKCFSCQRSCQKMQEMKFSHTEWKLQFRLSVFMLNSWFSFVSCQTVQQCFLPTHQPPPPPPPTNLCLLAVQKKQYQLDWLYSALSSGRFFIFSLFAVKCLWWLWLTSCCIVVWQTNGIQCMTINVYIVNLY